jgi:hypothetical protein
MMRRTSPPIPIYIAFLPFFVCSHVNDPARGGLPHRLLTVRLPTLFARIIAVHNKEGANDWTVGFASD